MRLRLRSASVPEAPFGSDGIGPVLSSHGLAHILIGEPLVQFAAICAVCALQ
jgi:hypothetical protein